MNNEFVKVHNKPKPILLCAIMHRKQQQCKIEILQISIEFCTVSWFVLIMCEECSCLFTEQCHIMGLTHQKYLILIKNPVIVYCYFIVVF